MALTSVPELLVPSFHTRSANTAPSYTGLLIDAVGERAAGLCRAPKTGNIAKIGFRGGAHTTNGNADVRLETIDLTTGNPSGTLFGTNTNGTQTINAANTWWTTTLTANAAVTEGDLLAVVIEVAAASALNTNIVTITNTLWAAGFPHATHFAAGAWTKQQSTPVFALEYDDGSYEFIAGVLPYSAFGVTTYNSGTAAADERGNRITLPYGARARGAYVFVDLDNVADVVLYDTDGTTALRTVSLDPDVRAATNASMYYARFSSSVSLTANGTYRLVLKPTSGSNVSLAEFSAASSAIMTGAIDGGAEIYHTRRVDAGAWTDTTTDRAIMGLLLDQIDLGSSAGILYDPGMAGGMNG